MQKPTTVSHERLTDAGRSPSRRVPMLTTLCIAVLLVQIDTTVVNLAARPIGKQLHAPVSALQWVVDGYNLVYASLLLTGGLLADLYGRRRVFMSGATIFTVASVECMLAPGIVALMLHGVLWASEPR